MSACTSPLASLSRCACRADQRSREIMCGVLGHGHTGGYSDQSAARKMAVTAAATRTAAAIQRW
jgi:hypothetical protein